MTRRRVAALIEVLGAVCLVVAAWHVGAGLAWLVGGVCLVAKAFELGSGGET